MMKLLILACLAVAALASPIQEPEWVVIDWTKVVPVTDLPGFWDGRDIKPATFQDGQRSARIVGGEIVTPHAHPYQAGLLLQFGGGTGLCGGSAISTTWVMTAAHCTVGSSSTQVVLGAHTLTANEASQQRRTVPSGSYRNHPSYNPNNLNNDIALLLLPTAVAFNQFVAASVIPALGAGDQHAGAVSVASGWGRIADGSQATSAQLRSVSNPIITNAVCAATYGTSVIFPGVVCTSTTGGRGPCNGDSGGPLTVAQGGGRLQVGIAAFVAGAGCSAGFPAGYARVSHFRQWIRDTTVTV